MFLNESIYVDISMANHGYIKCIFIEFIYLTRCGEHKIQYANNVLKNCMPETYKFY